MGERVLDIPSRSIERPFVTGRGADADCVVPSTSLALRQCVLFVREGRWVVEDWAPGGTQLNGRPLEGPTPLNVGDVLTIGGGANPAILEIDPGGAVLGRGGSPAPEATQTLAARAAAANADRPPPPPAARPRPAPRTPAFSEARFTNPNASPPQPRSLDAAPPAPGESVAGGEEEGGVDWGAATASAGEIALRRIRSQRRSSLVSMAIAIVLGLTIVGVTGWIVARKMREPVEVSVIEVPSPAPASPSAAAPGAPAAESPDSGGAQPGSDVAASNASASPPSSAAPAAADDPADPPDPHPGDSDWTDLLVARDMPDPAPALLRYDDYRRRNPGKNEKLLQQYELETLDRMWWRRIAQLCHRRDRLAGEIQEKRKAIAEERDATVKAQLQADLASLMEDRKTTNDTLRDDMGYAADQPPDLNDDKALDAARAGRSPIKFAAWSKDIGTYVRRNNGLTPWGNEDL